MTGGKFFVVAVVFAIVIITAGTLLFIYSINNLKIPNQQPTIISIKSEIVDVANERFISDQNEFILCLKGEFTTDGIIVTGYSEPSYVLQGKRNVSFSSCGIFDIGTLHSHPNGVCKASNSDFYAFGSTNHAFMGIMCGNDQFVFYTPQDIENPIAYEVAK